MILNYQFDSIEFVESESKRLLQGATLVRLESIAECFQRLVSGHGGFVYLCPRGWGRQLVDYISKNYIVVKAAGGIVSNERGERLIMERNGRFDLPKGKVEAGESLAQAALRETMEETGIAGLTIGSLWAKTYHIYNLYGGWHFKQTSWFSMSASSSEPLTPQLDEGITNVGWMDCDNWSKHLLSSYATMRLLVGM